MPLIEATAPKKEQSLLGRTIVVADKGPTPEFMEELPTEPRKWCSSAKLGQVHAAPASHANRYVETREPWTVSYEGDGIRANGQVVGFSEDGWHIVGEVPVQAGARLTLRVHRPDRSGTLCVPSATVQGVQGRAFVIRVQIQAASRTRP